MLIKNQLALQSTRQCPSKKLSSVLKYSWSKFFVLVCAFFYPLGESFVLKQCYVIMLRLNYSISQQDSLLAKGFSALIISQTVFMFTKTMIGAQVTRSPRSHNCDDIWVPGNLCSLPRLKDTRNNNLLWNSIVSQYTVKWTNVTYPTI